MFKAKKGYFYAHMVKGGMNLSIYDKNIDNVLNKVIELYNNKIEFTISKISDNNKTWVECYHSINN